MTADHDIHFGHRRRRHRRSAWVGWLVVAGVVALIAAAIWMRAPSISDRPGEEKTVRVVLPPPPPLPPPEVKPDETPPEPKPAPIEQAQDTPPPPTPQAEPAPGDSALTAREGAGPSNYGLAVGDGGGTRIGGRPGGGGGDGFAAYATVAQACIRQATQGDRELMRGRYTVQLNVSVGPDGRIANVGVPGGGDERRNARIREVLIGAQCSQRPPAGLPVMRIELSTRSGA